MASEESTGPPPVERIGWSLLAGGCFAASASLFVVPFIGAGRVWSNPLSDSDAALGVAALLAAFLVGGASWYYVEANATRRYVSAGVVAGVVTGTVAHPVMWFLWGLFGGSLFYAVLFVVVPLFWLFGLLLFGIVTIPLAVGAGVVVGTLRIVTIRYRERRAE
ncbi:MAG: hypothetical protein ACI8UR_000594 [Natronomonas sp.]|jgi:hypothetical protein|uniref:hypothetical protein n=1 Tax=Natronomonas sp. TaxID=2184060 RepID=UPI003989AF7A